MTGRARGVGSVGAARGRRADLPVRGAESRAKDDERLRADNCPASANAIYDVFEVVEVRHAEADECVRIACDREPLDQFGEVGERAVDVVDLRGSLESELYECLDRVPELDVVQYGSVSGDGSGPLKAVDTPLGGGGREPHLSPDLTRRTAPVFEQKLEDALIDAVQRETFHRTIVTYGVT